MRRIRAYIINFQVFGKKINISSSTFTVPKGVKKIDVFCVGGGAGGLIGQISTIIDGSGTSVGSVQTCGSGGGGGYTTTKLGVDVTPGGQIAVTVGAGGKCDSSSFSALPIGGTSSIGDICSAIGGCGNKFPYANRASAPTNGGSGGGWGAYYYSAYGSYSTINASDGASDGESMSTTDGFNQTKNPDAYGKGQGTTTRYFGESEGTLYAGGGGGGVLSFSVNGCNGGAGGGGNGGSFSANATDGSPNTGGGGGGNWLIGSNTILSQGGSGICIIRWDDQKS